MHRSLRRSTAVGIAALAFALAGCANAAPAPSSTDAAADTLDGEVSVYAAASLAGAFDEIATAFTAEHPDVTVVPVYDGSSTLVTQILEGAPADVFASADEANMDKAGDVAVDPELFASNTLVIAVPAGNPKGIADLADLADVTTVLCAAEVPCGAASAKLLDAAGVSIEAASLEQNVTAVLTKVETGEADAGLVYATDVIGRDDVEGVVPDNADDVVNHYPIAALADAPNPDAARAFVAFVLSDAGQAILAEFGFGKP
ncbi:molybdate ABC transporter substrate-binding protein [Microbacterium galbinum]|uniref:molybdate ABC transporter substrate-binding protein n=1 Tax=Microbacterium galbinum TaxID=2851646 RepID=UPI001FFD3FAC|nr:molybdate ABC transporter substrate-binding protein [Microbacterium galbinum]MCK2029770.1 molybdate ABC transporter substrate-binding protein [Microbacterium galbinum]